MNCKQANEQMMAYMDTQLSVQYTKKLKEHLDQCKTCKEDFALYETMLNAFESTSEQIFEAPSGFEEAVMEAILALPPLGGKASARMDNIVIGLFSAFSVLFGLGFVLVLNRISLLAYLQQTKGLESYATWVDSFSTVVLGYFNKFVSLCNTAWLSVPTFFLNYQFWLLGGAILLIFVQYGISNRVKKSNK